MKPALRLVKSKETASSAPDVPDLSERVRGYQAGAISSSTRSAYLSDWRHFAAWGEREGQDTLPAKPETVALYLAAHAYALRPATLTRRLVAIAQMHKAAGHEPPTRHSIVRTTFAGLRREAGTEQDAKAPLMADNLRVIVENIDLGTHLGLRDRALLLVGFAAALRRSELVAINAEDVKAAPEGMVLTLRRSKTDQEGRGRRVGIPWGANAETCPVLAYRAWIEATGIPRGPVFLRVDRHNRVLLGDRLTGHAVARIVKRHAERAGLDPREFAGHSLRAGLATSAARGGATEREIMRTTGHKSEQMVRRYIRSAELFKDSAVAATGL